MKWEDPAHTPYYLELNWSYTIKTDGTVVDSPRAEYSPADFSNMLQSIIFSFGKWILALMNFVAISLLVSLESVKFWQGIFIEWDWMMYDEV